jgi:ABC-type antimicrobial peptide transport system permease subunit
MLYKLMLVSLISFKNNSKILNISFINLITLIVLKDRESYYLSRPENNERDLINVQKELNLNIDVISSAPVYTTLQQLYTTQLFLMSTFMTIVFFMVLLSVMLIYSLMIADVDEKTYEMGMLRALGLRTVSLFQLIMIQSLIFSLPGVVIGII